MAEIVEIEKPDKTPLLKEKKPRPPQSEKQMQNFRAMQEIRAKKAEERKQNKILEAQRALLEKEGYVKAKPKVESQPLQFEMNDEIDSELEPEPEPVKVKVRKIKETLAPPPIQTPKSKPKPKVKKAKIPEPETDESGDSDSSEEIIVIKRKSKAKGKRSKQIYNDSDDYEEQPPINYTGFFC